MPPAKLHFGTLKKDKPFLTFHQTMHAADAVFYKGYDSLFLARKANLLHGLYKNSDTFWNCSEAWNLRFDDKDQLLNLLATELHMASLHQTEAMLAFLLCEFQNRPDWVYLTSYSNTEMKAAAKAVVAGDFGAITNGTTTDVKQFVKAAAFANWDFSNTEAADLWNRSVDDIAWLVGYVAERFSSAHEYNAYKHGLRVTSGQASLSVGSLPMKSNTLTPLMWMKHAVMYLELAEQTEGYVGSSVTKEISPEYSFELIQCMASVLLLAKTTRIARINKDLDSLDVPEIDRERLMSLAPGSKFSLPY